MGAIATGGVRVLNEDVVADLRIPLETVDAVTKREGEELARRERSYRGGREPPKLAGRTVVLVDDGLATGATMRAAVEAVRAQSPTRLVVAVPVAPPDTVARFKAEGVEVLCPLTLRLIGGVGSSMGTSPKQQTTKCERSSPPRTDHLRLGWYRPRAVVRRVLGTWAYRL